MPLPPQGDLVRKQIDRKNLTIDETTVTVWCPGCQDAQQYEWWDGNAVHFNHSHTCDICGVHVTVYLSVGATLSTADGNSEEAWA